MAEEVRRHWNFCYDRAVRSVHSILHGRHVASIALLALLATSSPSEAGEPAEGRPSRVYSVAQKTWIWPRPRVPREKPGEVPSSRFLGYVRVGTSVPLRSSEPVVGENCPGGFLAIAPRGFVCRDATVTLDAEHPFLKHDASARAVAGPFPYRYALSNGAPMYTRIPSAEEARRLEAPFGTPGTFLPMPTFQRGHEALAVTTPIAPADAVPEFVAKGKTARGPAPLSTFARTLPHGAMLSFTRAFEVGARTWLLSADLALVPADRVREFRRSSFAGVSENVAQKLPMAWFRSKPRPRYLRHADGTFRASATEFAVRSWVHLTGREERQGGRRYLETSAEDGAWTDAEDAAVIERRNERPFLVKPGEKWVVVNLTQGTLVAYDDVTPVYATLASPGRGGVPRPHSNALRDSTTPLGAYRITFKDRATTMSPEATGRPVEDGRRLWFSDVPFTQYFNAPFALHASYWHEDFGVPMSAGCINVSPMDAEWLFHWSGPTVPEGWQGATGAAAPENGPSTWVVVTR